MTIYHNRRTEAAYRSFATEPHYCENPNILQWWTLDHDRVTANQIESGQWGWYWGITPKFVAITPPDIIEIWRLVDPLCERYAWYNILMNFAISRAHKLGLTDAIRKPEWKVCPLCSQRFVEDSLPYPLVQRLGMDGLDICAPCISQVLFGWGDETMPCDRVLVFLQDLARTIGRVPAQGFGNDVDELRGLSTDERLPILRVLLEKPTIQRVTECYGSWLAALIEAGVLEDGTRRTSRGTQCLAKDGHVCLSLGEKTIDDFLFGRGIAHEKEPLYPEGNYRADFAVDGVLIEYFGLAGDPDYDAKARLKQRICRKHAVKLISVYPRDLASTRRLESKVLDALPLQEKRS